MAQDEKCVVQICSLLGMNVMPSEMALSVITYFCDVLIYTCTTHTPKKKITNAKIYRNKKKAYMLQHNWFSLAMFLGYYLWEKIVHGKECYTGM